MSLQLPAELIDQIVDECWRDLETLEICSQVCKAWRPRSLSHLFCAIDVRDDELLSNDSYMKTRGILPVFIQMPLSRFSEFVSRRSGRAVLRYVQHLVVRWGLYVSGKNFALRFPPPHTMNVQTLRIEGTARYRKEEQLYFAIAARFISACRANLRFLSAEGPWTMNSTVLSSISDCPRLHEVGLAGGPPRSFDYDSDASDSDEAPTMELPRLAKALYQPLRMRIDTGNATMIQQWIEQNSDLATIEAVIVTLKRGTQLIGKSTAVKSLRIQITDTSEQSDSTTISRVSSALQTYPTLRLLIMPVHSNGDPPKWVLSNYVDGIASVAMVLVNESVSCPTLHTLVLLDNAYTWEMSPPREDQDDTDTATTASIVGSDSKVNGDYDWAALDAALVMQKWSGVQHVAISLLARTTRDVPAMQSYFDVLVRNELTNFTARGGTVRVLCKAPYDNYDRFEFVEGYIQGAI